MFESFVSLADACLLYKVINGLTPPPLKEFVTLHSDNERTTWTTNRGDCVIQCRSSEFGKSALSVRASSAA